MSEMPAEVEGDYLIGVSKRGDSPSLTKIPPLLDKERGIKGVRLVSNLSTKVEGDKS